MRHLTLGRNALWEREIQVCVTDLIPGPLLISMCRCLIQKPESLTAHSHHAPAQHSVVCLQLGRKYVAVNRNSNITDVTYTTLCRQTLCITKMENSCSPIRKTQRTNPNYQVNLSLLLYHCCVWWRKALRKITHQHVISGPQHAAGWIVIAQEDTWGHLKNLIKSYTRTSNLLISSKV